MSMRSGAMPPFWCYATVLVVGLFTAVTKVNSHLEDRTGKWLIGGTWLLLLCYVTLPLGLFFVLDRTHALHDTSLLAAVIVGVTYNRILAGSVAAMPVPDQVSSWWPSFIAWADKVSEKVAERDDVNEQRFTDRIVAKVLDNDGKYEAFYKVVKTRVENLTTITKALETVEKEVTDNAVTDEKVIRERKVRRLFDYISELSDFQYMLYKRGVINRAEYAWYVRGIRTWCLWVGVIALLTAMLAVAAWRLNQPLYRAAYDVWRIGKPNSTKFDLQRSRQRLADYLENEEDGPSVAEKLVQTLMLPDLAAHRVDVILQLLLENQATKKEPDTDFTALFVDALRTSDVDRRSRLHEAMLYLAAQWGLDVTTVEQWKPATGDSVPDLESRIRQWKQVFSTKPTGKKATA